MRRLTKMSTENEYCEFGHCRCVHRNDGHCDPKILGENCEIGETSEECEAFWKARESEH